MKAISIKNPFANLVAMGYKTIETRVESSPVARTKYRGEILICTSVGAHPFWNDVLQSYNFNEQIDIDPYFKKAIDNVWNKSGKDWYEFGNMMMNPIGKSMAIATAKLVDIVDMLPEHQLAACCSLYPSAKSIMLEDVEVIEPFEIAGLTNGFHLGVFDVNLKEQIFGR